MSGYLPYGPDGYSAQGHGGSSPQDANIDPNKAESAKQRSIGHRRQRTELIGYKFPEPKLERGLAREPEHLTARTQAQRSRQELLKNAGPDDGPYPWFARPVPRIDYWAVSNVDRWDPYHPGYAGNDESRELPSVELPRAVSPIDSFQLLGMTGSVAPSQDSQEWSSSQDPGTRAASAVGVPTAKATTFANDRFRTRCCSFFGPSHKKVQWIIYSCMGFAIVNIAVTSVIYDKAPLEGPTKIAVISWLGGSVLAFVLLLIFNNARSSNLQERGRNVEDGKYWIEMGNMSDNLPAPSRARLNDNGVVLRSHAGGRLPSLTNISHAYACHPSPSETTSKSKLKSNTSSGAAGGDQAIRGGCVVAGSSGSSSKSRNSGRSTSTQYSNAGGIGIARSDSLRKEEEMIKAMNDRHRMMQLQNQSAGGPAKFAVDSDSGSSVEEALPTEHQGRASLPNFSFPLSCRPGEKSKRVYGPGLPPRDTWCKEPRGSMSNLRQDHYGNKDPGPSSAAPSGMANGDGVPKHGNSLTARFNELTPITERSYEGTSPLALTSPYQTIQSPSNSGGAIPSSPPSAYIPPAGSGFF